MRGEAEACRRCGLPHAAGELFVRVSDDDVDTCALEAAFEAAHARRPFGFELLRLSDRSGLGSRATSLVAGVARSTIRDALSSADRKVANAFAPGPTT